MYDFYLGTSEDIKKDEARFLLAIKRMMPRWVNSIADSEFIALTKLLETQGKRANDTGRKFIAIETGVGASTLAFIFYSMKYDGLCFSWDFNGEKGSIVRTISTETIGNYFKKHIDNYWKHIAYNSLSPYLGLPILKEMVDHIDLFFHDSEHTWKTVKGELDAVMPMLADGAVIAIDDANQDFVHTNLAYVNTFRRKYGLKLIDPLADNKTEPYYIKIEKMLKSYWEEVQHLHDLYKENYLSDPYFSYYNAEFDIKASLGTERTENLDHRFDSWQVNKRKKGD